VCREEIGAFSQFALILQKIARADLEASYFPKTSTRKIQKRLEYPDYVASATLFVDDLGRVTPAEDTPALPRKKRYDNFGQYSELRSVINASAKSPQ
jgi:hypothetical protein